MACRPKELTAVHDAAEHYDNVKRVMCKVIVLQTHTFLMLLNVPKFWSLCTRLESKGWADAVPSGMSHLQQSRTSCHNHTSCHLPVLQLLHTACNKVVCIQNHLDGLDESCAPWLLLLCTHTCSLGALPHRLKQWVVHWLIVSKSSTVACNMWFAYHSASVESWLHIVILPSCFRPYWLRPTCTPSIYETSKSMLPSSEESSELVKQVDNMSDPSALAYEVAKRKEKSANTWGKRLVHKQEQHSVNKQEKHLVHKREEHSAIKRDKHSVTMMANNSRAGRASVTIMTGSSEAGRPVM